MGALDAEMVANKLASKIRSLPAAYIAELEDFIECLVRRAQGRTGDHNLTRRSMQVSERALAAVWDNPEDDVYDAL